MKYYLLSDCRENFKNEYINNDNLYNDHPSKKNIDEVTNAIISNGYMCEYFGGIPELINAIEQNRTFENCCFINFTDGMEQQYSRVQAPILLDILNVPYSGSDVFPTTIMNNKHYCKLLLKDINICMPKSFVINKKIQYNKSMISSWNYPIFVKPNCEGSSLGISNENVCHTEKELCYMINKIVNIFGEAIIEEYVSGIDLTNYIIGNQYNYSINDVIISELDNKSPFAVYGVDEKVNKLRTLYFNEEYLSYDVLNIIKTTSIKIFDFLGAKDICRIDYRYDYTKNNLYFLEANSAPRFSSTSEIGFIAQKRGFSFEQMVNIYLFVINKRINSFII
jgi:D-alanine-D-alanine ligase